LRLIDVKEGYLVTFDKASTQIPRYIALSYMWGSVKGPSLLIENLSELHQQHAVRDLALPRTIVDAIEAVERLGEQFLWVDALCITQDDLPEKPDLIPRMDFIYSKALLTIIAAAGSDANSGLPGIRPGTRSFLPMSFTMGPIHFLPTLARSWEQFDHSQGTRWSTRGWTFQEGHLSKRRLIFTTEQVLWTCGHMTRCEETCLEGLERFHPFGLSLMSTFTRGSALRDRVAVWQDKSLQFYIHAYSQKLLSFEGDRLNAFKGILSHVSQTSRDHFFADLPGSYFGKKLKWEGFSPFPILDERGLATNSQSDSNKHYPFPSWSWLAWKSQTIPFT
jgi:hypothetical protein